MRIEVAVGELGTSWTSPQRVEMAWLWWIGSRRSSPLVGNAKHGIGVPKFLGVDLEIC